MFVSNVTFFFWSTWYNISDHDASVVIIKCSKNISRSLKREIWQYQKIKYEKFEEKLNEINWNEKLDHLNDVDEMCEKFTNCFLKIAKECIPSKIVTIRNNDRPWFSQFSGCWLILSVYIIMSFDFPFVRLFGVR